MSKVLRIFLMVAGFAMTSGFQTNSAYADENCLNLQTIGEEAAKITHLEVRTDITDIEGFEQGYYSKGYVGGHLNDSQNPDINNYFFSFKHDPQNKHFPNQGGCAAGSVVRIPESSHYEYFTILESSPNELKLRSVRSGGVTTLRKINTNTLQLIAETFDNENNPVCNPNNGTYRLTYSAIITWGEAGSLKSTAPSEHWLELFIKYGSNTSLTECLQ